MCVCVCVCVYVCVCVCVCVLNQVFTNLLESFFSACERLSCRIYIVVEYTF